VKVASTQQDDWDRHWTDYASAAERNPAQQYRRRLVLSQLGARGARARILDIGSGQGDMIAHLRAMYPGAELCGIDCSREGVELAAQKAPSAAFVVRDLVQPGGPPEEMRGWATHAVCSEVLEHVDEPVSLLANARGYLRAGCRLVVTVPGGPMSAFDRHIGHRRHFTLATLRQTLEQAGFQVETVTGAGFPFFNLYRLVVILRGEGLITDVAGGHQDQSAVARLLMSLFRGLFALNLPGGAWGWQLVAVASLEAAPSGSL
jgi:trans-aconitate methyltransferase